MKQTATNNTFLALVKKVMNAKVYKHVLAITNDLGEVEARKYLNVLVKWDYIESHPEDYLL